MKLVPLGDRVVLKQFEAEETTKSGIILTSKTQEKPQEAEVIAVGPGGLVDGKEVTMQVKVGDKVIYSKYSGNEVKLGEEEYIIVKQSDILAVVEEDNCTGIRARISDAGQTKKQIRTIWLWTDREAEEEFRRIKRKGDR